MSGVLKRVIHRLLGPADITISSWIRAASTRRGARTFSQDAEDRLLERIFPSQEKGCYVDVGAHHPYRFSNTFLFYRKGWTGLNIDATPGSMKLFRRHRPRDINVEMGVDERARTAMFHIFSDPALNTLDEGLARDYQSRWKLLRTVQINVSPLSTILREHLRPYAPIDFLNVDVEGRDIQVLKSNDWSQYRPRVVLVEMLNHTIDSIPQSECYLYLASIGYRAVARTINTTFFFERDFEPFRY